MVPDTTAPVIHSVVASPNAIWPPNGKMVPRDRLGERERRRRRVTVLLHQGDLSEGGDASDATINGQFAASVRAEKNGDGSTRVYIIKVMCKDAAGNTSFGSTTVVVGKDMTALKGALKAHAMAMLKKLVVAVQSKGYLSRGSSR